MLVNYNKTITSALHYYTNDHPEESARQLSKLTKVTHLDKQLKEYSHLSVLEMKNREARTGGDSDTANE